MDTFKCINIYKYVPTPVKVKFDGLCYIFLDLLYMISWGWSIFSSLQTRDFTLGASVNIMPKATFEKLSYPTLFPTMMCVQLANSTIWYPESIIKNLLVQVKNTFIVADFVVLNMEEDLGISLILVRPFLRDARAIIDVGTGKISLLIMGKNMKFMFQYKTQELFLIHEDDKREGLHAELGWED